MKLEFCLQIFEKYSNIRFQENPFIWSTIAPFEQTDEQTNMPKLFVALPNFANAWCCSAEGRWSYVCFYRSHGALYFRTTTFCCRKV